MSQVVGPDDDENGGGLNDRDHKNVFIGLPVG